MRVLAIVLSVFLLSTTSAAPYPEDKMDQLILKYSDGLDPRLIKAVIMQESTGNAGARRFEKSCKCYSNGIMQVRYSTAQWLGYTGDEVGLLLPDTNIEFGTKYLRYQLKRYGNTRDAIAAYNSGTVRHTSNGLYRNQDYVDGVLNWYGKTKLIIPTLVLPLIN